MKYNGALEIQIFDAATKMYVPYPFLPPDRIIARELAGNRPWRICKSDRPLKPDVKDHYKEYHKIRSYGGKDDIYEGRS